MTRIPMKLHPSSSSAAAEDFMSFHLVASHLAKLTHRRDNWSCPAIRWCWGTPVTARRGGGVGRFYGWLRPYPLAELNMWHHVAHLDPSKSSKCPRVATLSELFFTDDMTLMGWCYPGKVSGTDRHCPHLQWWTFRGGGNGGSWHFPIFMGLNNTFGSEAMAIYGGNMIIPGPKLGKPNSKTTYYFLPINSWPSDHTYKLRVDIS